MSTLFSVIMVKAQNLNQEINSEGESPYLIGKIDKSGLRSDNYSQWFNQNFEDYQPDLNTLAQLSKLLNSFSIKVFLGTWCGDSKREVPRLYKILEACKFPDSQLEVIALSGKHDLYKQSPEQFEKNLNIHRVPTFIVYKSDKEINRIIEYPVESLEKDLLMIVTSNQYLPQYNIVQKIDKQLKHGTFKISKRHIKRLKLESKKMSELNTYAHMLFTSNREADAIKVLEINTLLFPKDYKTFENLANKYYAMNHIELAIKYYKVALKMNPDNQNLQSYIATLENISK